MLQERTPLDRVLDATSRVEVIEATSPTAEMIVNYIRCGLMGQYDNFSVKAGRIEALASRKNKPAQHPLVARAIDADQFPEEEVERSFNVSGVYGPDSSVDDCVTKGERETEEPPGLCMFTGTIHLYFHSTEYDWEVGRIEFELNEDGEQSDPITVILNNRPFLDARDGHYEVNLLREFPEM